MTRPMRVGIIGCGGRGSQHGRCAATSDEVDVVAWCDADRSKAEKLAAEHGGQVVDSLDAMLADDAIDGVVISVLHDMHHAMGMAATAAGKAIMMEIPVASRLDQAAELIDAAERAGVLLLVTHTLRFRGENITIKRMIEGGAIGTPFFARYHNEHFVRLDYFGRQGGENNFAVEASVLHHGDLMRWWLGDMDALTAYGMSVTDVSRSSGVFDHLTVIYQWADRALAETTCSWFGTPIQLSGRERMALSGTEGGMLLTYDNHLHIYRDGKERIIKPAELSAAGCESEIVHFARCMTGIEQPAVTPHDAYRALQLMLLCLESAKDRRRVDVPTVDQS
jgi:UDP-N-acetylglucosamine 3-dehydrogenase